MKQKRNALDYNRLSDQIIQLLQSVEFKELINSIVNPIVSGNNKNAEKEILMQKEQFAHEKEMWEAQNKLVKKWQFYNLSIYSISVVAIGLLGWLAILPATVVGTLLAAIIGYVFGEKDRKRREDK